jgi:hypothetical protein
MKIQKYSFGVGDRFGHQGKAQLSALLKARKEFGVDFIPVWNKSNREHQIVGTEPGSTRVEADAAVKALGYTGQYFVDADHINLGNVDRFINSSDFFTLDVADYIGKPADIKQAFALYIGGASCSVGKMRIPSIYYNISLIQQRKQLFYEIIHRLACFYHKEYFPGSLQTGNEIFQTACAVNVFARTAPFHEIIHFFLRAIVNAYAKAFAFHIENQILAHDGEAYQANVAFFHYISL